jgi:pimeloyl-ACP methyl ester carboxylesterase
MDDYTHDTAPTQFTEADGIRFAYRRFGNPGTGRSPVVFFQHFIGNLDDHDPAISDGLGTDREVILFDNTGVAALFAPTESSQKLGREYVERIIARKDRDASAFGEQVYAGQGTAIHAYGTTKDPAYSILKNIRIPVLVVNGTSDIIIPTINSYILQQFLPDAELIIYPDANHGAHFQYPDRFVTDAKLFLDR